MRASARRSRGGRPPDLPTGTIDWMRCHWLSLMRSRAIFFISDKNTESSVLMRDSVRKKTSLRRMERPFRAMMKTIIIRNPARCAGLGAPGMARSALTGAG